MRFLMSLTVIRPLSTPSCVDDRELLDLVPVEQRLASRQRRADGCGDEVARGHQLRDELRVVVLEAEVAVGEDPGEAAAPVHDRHARDPVALHQLERGRDGRVGRQRDRVDDHARLRALDLVDLGDLRVDRQVAVEDADPALARERDRHPRLGDGVHRRRDERDLELDAPREARASGHIGREHRRGCGHEQDVVERQPFLRELRLETQQPLDLLGRSSTFIEAP